MRTDFIVIGMEPMSGPAPEGTTVHCQTSEEAFAEAHRMMVECANAVVTVWGRSGRNMWPVRILYPGTRGSTSSIAYGLPVDSPRTYMVDTQHAQHVLMYPTGQETAS